MFGDLKPPLFSLIMKKTAAKEEPVVSELVKKQFDAAANEKPAAKPRYNRFGS
jgi:hypothetical protein